MSFVRICLHLCDFSLLLRWKTPTSASPMTTSTVTVEQFSALRVSRKKTKQYKSNSTNSSHIKGFKHFDVVALSASTVQFDWRTHIHVRAFIDILSAQHVRVRFFDASIAQFEVRRATAQRVVRELLGAIRRQVTEFPRVENCFQIDFDLLERQITPTSSPLMRSMLCGALVRFRICLFCLVLTSTTGKLSSAADRGQRGGARRRRATDRAAFCRIARRSGRQTRRAGLVGDS